MCGRFSLAAAWPILADIFDLDDLVGLFAARYNAAPSQPIATIRAGADGRRRLESLRWGLIPRWTKDPKAGPAPINARAETVAEKSMYKGSLRSRRCIVPADGFFEWKKEGKLRRPHYFQMHDRRPFGIAALWESWKGPDGVVESVALVTTAPNELVSEIHDRMPAILHPGAYAAWLDRERTNPAELLPMLGPYPAEQMTMTAVGSRVNSPLHDDPECVAPLS